MNVFISYRRQDDQFLPALVREQLLERLGGGEVFLDIDSIPVGSDFGAYIRSWIARADVVLALIGPRWRPELLVNDQDFVRLELRSAHDLGKMVVPVLHSQQRMPSSAELPADLAWLPTRNAFTVGAPPNHMSDLRRLVLQVLSLETNRADSVESDVDAACSDRPVRADSLDFLSQSDHGRAIRQLLRRDRRKVEP